MTEMKNSRELINELLRKGYLLKEIAEYTGFTESSLCYIKRGQGVSTSLDLWCGLASMLDYGNEGDIAYRWHPEVLARLRAEKGFTQAELGRKLGLGRSTIAYYEDPYGTYPRVNNFMSICLFFGVDYSFFIGEAADETSESEGIA